MAYKKSDQNHYVNVLEKEYLTLVKDHVFMNALRTSGILDDERIYKAIEELMKDGRVEVHVRPIKSNYR